MIKFGPAALGGIKDAEKNLEEFHRLGLKACEVSFTRSIYIKDQDTAKRIGKKAKELGIQLSIHAPYYINLNSADPEIIEKSKQRILKCCEIGTWLGAYRVVFHAGFYGKIDRKISYENIRNQMLDLENQRKENKFPPKLAPEIMGKINVFGSINEIHKLVQETGCSFCIDFAHILARYKTYNFKEVSDKFSDEKEWHIHFSGIEHGDKGEKHHLKTEEEEIRRLLSNLPSGKQIVIINESPETLEDAVASLNIYQNEYTKSDKHISK
jgi:deoxyribonuclease IV